MAICVALRENAQRQRRRFQISGRAAAECARWQPAAIPPLHMLETSVRCLLRFLFRRTSGTQCNMVEAATHLLFEVGLINPFLVMHDFHFRIN